jgi:hypothetical protein
VKRDDCRMLRSLFNAHGWFIVTSKNKLYMKLRHRMELHKFPYIHEKNWLDIPELYLEAPQGSSLFQTPTEKDYTEQNRESIQKKYQDMVQSIKQAKSHTHVEPWKDDAKIWSKILFSEPKPKKDTYFWNICNDDYNSFVSHIATNQHRLSSYSENLALYYDKIDQINLSLQSDLIDEVESLSSPRLEKFSDTPEKSSKEDSSLDNRIHKLNQLVNNILYRDKPEEGKL